MVSIKKDANCTFLLTGATGLVGRYMLALLLKKDRDVAVLVRDTNHATAEQRTNLAVQIFERAGLLPRPRVISGELTCAGLGVSNRDLRWLQQRKVRVIHCAASIRFALDAVSGEPFRTNVEGTRNLLEFCQQLDVDEFHYVSTAYVGCRNTTGPAAEVAVTSEELAGNDYERSKIQAEQLVHACQHISRRVIHRPSIVIGDSTTGYTSTFHGFYAPLQIGAQFAKSFGFASEAGDWFRNQLGIQQDDSKNLVPVDWVAASIVEVAVGESCNGESPEGRNSSGNHIYHWTNPRPVACHQMQAAIVDSIEAHVGHATAKATAPVHDVPSPESFRKHMAVYESYFGNDLTFDASHALVACPHLPCPESDYKTLRRMADYALAQQFGWPRSFPKSLPYRETIDRLEAFPTLTDGKVPDRVLAVQLLGLGAPERLRFEMDGTRWIQARASGPVETQLVLSLECFWNCLSGTVGIDELIQQGRASVTGGTPGMCSSIVSSWLAEVQKQTACIMRPLERPR